MNIVIAANTSMSPVEVRRRVLVQHEALRGLFREILAVSIAARRGQADAISKLIPLLREIRVRMLSHLAFEETALVPVLRKADAWGPERVETLLAEHARQRAELESLIEGEAGAWDDAAVALILETLVSDILVDMEEEERGTLSPSILRDDIVAVDQCTD